MHLLRFLDCSYRSKRKGFINSVISSANPAKILVFQANFAILLTLCLIALLNIICNFFYFKQNNIEF